ncbi:hypothetical protein HK405_003566, partial [Cladochytrium tenue]
AIAVAPLPLPPPSPSPDADATAAGVPPRAITWLLPPDAENTTAATITAVDADSAIAALAVAGWEPTPSLAAASAATAPAARASPVGRAVHCHLCLRAVSLAAAAAPATAATHPKPKPIDAPGDALRPPPGKRPRVDADGAAADGGHDDEAARGWPVAPTPSPALVATARRLDVVREHRWYCPWVRDAPTVAALPGEAEAASIAISVPHSPPVPPPGWKLTLRAVYRAAGIAAPDDPSLPPAAAAAGAVAGFGAGAADAPKFNVLDARSRLREVLIGYQSPAARKPAAARHPLPPPSPAAASAGLLPATPTAAKSKTPQTRLVPGAQEDLG